MFNCFAFLWKPSLLDCFTLPTYHILQTSTSVLVGQCTHCLQQFITWPQEWMVEIFTYMLRLMKTISFCALQLRWLYIQSSHLTSIDNAESLFPFPGNEKFSAKYFPMPTTGLYHKTYLEWNKTTVILFQGIYDHFQWNLNVLIIKY